MAPHALHRQAVPTGIIKVCHRIEVTGKADTVDYGYVTAKRMTMASKALGAKRKGELRLLSRQSYGICASTMEIGSKSATGFLGSREQMLDIRRLQKRQVAMNDHHRILQSGS